MYIPDLIQNGFDVGFREPLEEMRVAGQKKKGGMKKGDTEDNDAVQKYIYEGWLAGQISPSLLQKEVEDALGFFQTSPIGLVPREDGDKRNVRNFSYPDG